MRIRPEREVSQLRGLPGARLRDLGPAVPDLADEQPCPAVQVTLAALIVNVLALTPDNDGDIAGGIRRHPGEVKPKVALRFLLQGHDLVVAVRRTHLVPQL